MKINFLFFFYFLWLLKTSDYTLWLTLYFYWAALPEKLDIPCFEGFRECLQKAIIATLQCSKRKL